MAVRIICGTAVLVLTGIMSALPARPTAEGPPPGFSGGFGEPSCVACHLGSDANAFGGRVILEGLPTAYEPGGEYLLTVLLQAEGTVVAGFQVTARFSNGSERRQNAGTLSPVDGRSAVTDSAGISYLHQSRAGSLTRSGSGSSWTLRWIAPPDGGAVTLNVAAN